MFNDLNSGQNNHQPVDDIFAETDKASTPQAGNIETHRVGLTALNEGAAIVTNEETAIKPGMPWFKILASIIVVAILVLSAYLVYSKFFKSSAVIISEEPLNKKSTTTAKTNTNAVVATTSVEAPVYVSEIPGLATTTIASTSVATSSNTGLGNITPITPIDSDSDGLTDEEEKIYHTDPLVVDTDKDGLSDYEEVKIYHTNPLVADTDGDGFLDGNEVKNGYNPNGAGKMPGVISLPATGTSSPKVNPR